MLTTTGADVKANLAVIAVLVGVAALLPIPWRAGARRSWSYVVYCVGYRVLSVQYSCGSLAVSGGPLVMKLAA